MNCIINLNTSSRYCSTAALQKCRLQMWALSALDTCHYNQNAGRYIRNDGQWTRSSATALRNPRSDLSLFLRPGMETKGVNEISRYVKGSKDFLLKKPPVNDDICSPNFRWRDCAFKCPVIIVD